MSTRRAPRLLLAVLFLCWPLSHALAQNENETVGFQSNHAFESGHFGENIDVLNGGLNVSIPIGPKYQVTDRLGYQLLLSYASKVWDYSDFGAGGVYLAQPPPSVSTDPTYYEVMPQREGAMGLGLTLNLGRLVQDAHWTLCDNAPNAAQPECYQRSWAWVTQDGNQHEFWWRENFSGDTHQYPTDTMLQTTDLSYIRVDSLNNSCTDASDPGCMKVHTPDGLTYTLGHHVNFDWISNQQTFYDDTTTHLQDIALRHDNLSFGGWYVTKIEDTSLSPAPYITVTYDTRPNFEHVIRSITDSTGRRIDFFNTMIDPTTGAAIGTNCADNSASVTGAPDRHRVLTDCIAVPGFASSESIIPSATAKYQFAYDFTQIHRGDPNDENLLRGPVLELKRIDYPDYVKNGQTLDHYSLYLGYFQGGVNRGELTCRTLPVRRGDPTTDCFSLLGGSTETAISYAYDYYFYSPLYFAGGKLPSWGQETGGGVWKNLFGPRLTQGSPTRMVITKSLHIPGQTGLTCASPPASIQNQTWSYQRTTGNRTNPQSVTVTDPFCNDTVYNYFGSVPNPPPPAGDHTQDGRYPDDGSAPEWNDGQNYRTEYYAGSTSQGGSRTLLRTEFMDFDSDQDPNLVIIAGGPHTKANVRMTRKRTDYNDSASTPESAVSYQNWDGSGHWKTVSETGTGVTGTRMTQTDYFNIAAPYFTGPFNFREVSDGLRVLSRTENDYNAQGRLVVSIDRNTLPIPIGTPKNTAVMGDGDLKTTYLYFDNSSALKTKTLSRWSGGAEVKDYCIDYDWTLMAYLKSKTFKDCVSGTPLPWKAIDRQRDGNTGLIFSSKDTAGFATLYDYDALGRLLDITPAGSEIPTSINYVSLRSTEVTRGTGSDFEFQRYSYDGLGRLTCQEKRPADPTNGYPYQTTRYDVADRVTFKSEWLQPGTSCDPGATVGTQFSYKLASGPTDPFGRVQSVTTADNQVTTTTYSGLDSTVTVPPVAGVNPNRGAASIQTTYNRDAWGRLIKVDTPASLSKCNGSGAYCTSNYACNPNLTVQCLPVNGTDALYTYDLRDQLTRVDLIGQAPDASNAQTREFEYDGLNRLHLASNPENGTVVYTAYDSLGNVLSMTDAGGVTTNYTYDLAGRLSKVSLAGNPSVVLTQNTYDLGTNGLGKLYEADSYGDDGSIGVAKVFSYVGLNGRLSEVDYGFGWGWPKALYGYDNYGNVSQINYPDMSPVSGSALTVAYGYANGFPVTATDATGTPAILASVTYNLAGGVKTLTSRSSARTLIQTDSRNRPSDITIGKWVAGAFSGTPYYESGAYAYDGAGNISQIGTNQYFYDNANRLYEADESYGGLSYEQCLLYDVYGNVTERTNVTSPGTQHCDYFLGATNQDTLVTAMTSAPNTNRINYVPYQGANAYFDYDARGNLTKDIQRRYQYDARNRLLSLALLASPTDESSSGTQLLSFSYDSDGNRVVKTDPQRELNTFELRGTDGKVLSEFRRTLLGTYTPELVRNHVYLAGREVALRENRVPNPPGGLWATTTRQGGSSNVLLHFRPNPPEDAVQSYALWRSTNGGTFVNLGTSSFACSDAAGFTCMQDLSIPSDTLVSYQVAASNTNGWGYGSDVLDLIAGDRTAPNPPSCVQGKAGDRRVTLSWGSSSSTDVVGYKVYRDTSTGGQHPLVNQVLITGTTYVDAGLANGTPYYYWVHAVDSVSNESADDTLGTCTGSLPFTAMPKDYTAPGPPRNLMVAGDCTGGGTATLTWDKNATTDGVSGYYVYRSPTFSSGNPIAAGLDAQGQPKNTYIDTGLLPNTVYYYWVTAKDALVNGNQNESLPSQKVGLAQRSNLITAPGKLSAIAGNGQVRLRTSLPNDPGTSTPSKAVAALIFYRRANGGSCTAYTQVGMVTAENTGCLLTDGTCTSVYQTSCNPCALWDSTKSYRDFTEGTVPNGQAWDYAVTSRDFAGNESGFSDAALAIPVTPPSNYRECIDVLTAQDVGTADCSGGVYKRYVQMWDPPANATTCQPHAGGPFDNCLVGYRMARYSLHENGVSPYISDESHITDQGLTYADPALSSFYLGGDYFCEEEETQATVGACPGTCGTASTCIQQSTCANSGMVGVGCLNDSDCGGWCNSTAGACTGTPVAMHCMNSNDCTYRSGGYDCFAFPPDSDSTNPKDPHLLPPTPTVGVYSQPSDNTANNNDCLAVRAVYLQSANSYDRYVMSAYTSNFDAYNLGADIGAEVARCAFASHLDNPCFDTTTPLCPAHPDPPTQAVLYGNRSSAGLTATPPRHLKAYAPVRNGYAQRGIYLEWCPNPANEHLDGYNVYRSQQSGGPYMLIAKLLPDAVLGTVQYQITSVPSCLGITNCTCPQSGTCFQWSQPLSCTRGSGGDCRVIDLSVTQPTDQELASLQNAKIYYYVITATYGSWESGYSEENIGMPNYLCGGGLCSCNDPSTPCNRYDPDNFGDVVCGSEVSELERPDALRDGVMGPPGDGSGPVARGSASPAHTTEARGDLEQGPIVPAASPMNLGFASPYRTIGQKKHGGGGGGGGGGSGSSPPPPPVFRWWFYHSDHLGSPRVVVEDLGNLVTSYHFLPFGQQAPIASRTTSNDIFFTGHQRDVESATADSPDGLDYMLARYYSSSLGRFMRVDPTNHAVRLEQPQSWNYYAYVQNNPILLADPTGESPPSNPGMDDFLKKQLWKEPLDVNSADKVGDRDRVCVCGGDSGGDEEEKSDSWNPSEPFPSDPSMLGPDWRRDTEHRAPNDERYVNDKTGDKVDWHKGQPGEPGEQGKDHWHWVPGGKKQDKHYKPGDTIKQVATVTAYVGVGVGTMVVIDIMIRSWPLIFAF